MNTEVNQLLVLTPETLYPYPRPDTARPIGHCVYFDWAGRMEQVRARQYVADLYRNHTLTKTAQFTRVPFHAIYAQHKTVSNTVQPIHSLWFCCDAIAREYHLEVPPRHHTPAALVGATTDAARLALESSETVPAQHALDQIDTIPVDFYEIAPQGYQVIDVRHPDEVAQNAIASDLHIPYFQIQQKFPSLPLAQRFLLFCARGVFSRLHAELLIERGFHNVGVLK